MRMRRLERDHSVMFFAPLEVDQKIRTITAKGNADRVEVQDLLRWAIGQSFDDIERNALRWAFQGVDHARRYDAWASYAHGESTEEDLSEVWCQPQAKTLEELYSPYHSQPCNAPTLPNGIQERL